MIVVIHPLALPRFSGCGRAIAWNAAHTRAAESAQADFVTLQPRFELNRPRTDPAA